MQFTAHTQTFPTTWDSERCKGPSKMHLRTAKRAKAVCTDSPPSSTLRRKNPSRQPFKGFELRCQGIISKWHLQVIRGQRIILVTCGKGGKLQGQISQYLNVGRCFVYTKSVVWFMMEPCIQNFNSASRTAENVGGNGIKNSYNTFKYFTDSLLLK